MDQVVVLLASEWEQVVDDHNTYRHTVMLGLTKVVEDFGRRTRQAAGYQVVHTQALYLDGERVSARPNTNNQEFDNLVDAVKAMQDIQHPEEQAGA